MGVARHSGLDRRIEAGGLAQRIHQLDKGGLPGRVVAGLVAEHHLDLALRHIAQRRSTACGTSGVRRSAASGTPNSTTATIETAAASDHPTMVATPPRPGLFSSSRGQRAMSSGRRSRHHEFQAAPALVRRQAGQAKRSGRTVGAADVLIRPGDHGLQRLVEFKPIPEHQRHQTAAAWWRRRNKLAEPFGPDGAGAASSPRSSQPMLMA